MPSQSIFCNAPWYELQIYWDGSLGFCCQEDHKVYPDHLSTHYNIQNISIQEWMASEPMQAARMMMFDDKRSTVCRRCYIEEDHSTTSRRHRSNQKSVIFTRTNFIESYEQSPGYDKFELSRNTQGAYGGLPLDLHIDLGNYCNLTCKMCNAKASSSIASQQVKWSIADAKQYIGSDWTRNDTVWTRVLTEIANIPNLSNVHFMGGETLITKRFEDFIDFMIAHNRFDLHFSFVTNGTKFNESLLNKLKKFKRVGIEVSIETLTAHNAYQRQGTDTAQVLANIDRYLTHCNNTNITLTMRPAISALTIGHYDTLLRFCLERNLVVKGLIVFDPEFLDVRVLPITVRNAYKQKYLDLMTEYKLDLVDCTCDYNESDPNQIGRQVKNQILQCINLLDAKPLTNSDELFTAMVAWCRKWDTVHAYDALELYPELRDEFITRGY